MVSAFRLPMQFDPGRMLSELDALERREVWLTHPDYTVARAGDWTAIALMSTDGDHTGPDSLRYRGGSVAAPTKLLVESPYLRSVVEAFHTEVHRVRLMNLRPGTVIAEHRDYGAQRYSFGRGYIRVHIPIRTHEAVAWRLNGRKIPMHAGEPWYVNVCQPHAVENLSEIHRVHMVLDMKVNDWVRGLFPRETLGDRAAGWILRRFERPWLQVMRRVQQTGTRTKEKLGDLGLRELKRRWIG